jgi:plastocyanin
VWRQLGCGMALSLPMLAAAAQLNVQVLSVSTEPVSDVIVYLDITADTTANTPQSAAPAARSVDVLQHDKRFVPYVSVIQRNDKVVFRNSDDITHQIYSATGPAHFAFQLRAGESHTVTEFAQAGVVAMGCNIHDWMSGYILVINSALFTSSAKDGWARFADLPAGDYRVSIWHPQMREQLAPVHVDGLATDRELRIQLTKKMAEVPRQKALDDFDFLEGY